MENNKYYTPSIEEFRVGFECEYFNSFAKNFLQIEIDESNYYTNSNDGGSWDEDYIFASENKFRVKYLDTQDIKELGFKYIPDLSEGDGNVRWYDLYEKGNISLLHWDYSDKDNKVVIKRNNTIIFEGTILNKSELKWIFTRIGVL